MEYGVFLSIQINYIDSQLLHYLENNKIKMAEAKKEEVSINESDGTSLLSGGTAVSLGQPPRTGQEHSFLMDQTYVEEMEEGLLKLLNNFKNDKLNAFDENCSLEKMRQIKNMQEGLAQLHFNLENEENSKTASSEEDRTKKNQEKMEKLMKNLENLCSSVQNLHQHLDVAE